MAEQKQNRPRGGGPGRGMSAPVEKAKDFKGTIKKLVSYLGASRNIRELAISTLIKSVVSCYSC